ncbi:sugar kinase [Motilimonas eburnea]|uniref:sugar kinase n=1 Tax=Motilimonas eburnea TaxID=1737488 RepID=UPI001E3061DF|nr:sugar kinase [Motilimonas eburnea]MCE2573320.1 sugar kinase [Motilimonas eburnea]
MAVNKVAVLGECMVELQRQGELYRPNFGGDTLNTAVYFSRLTADKGVSTAYLTGLGQDDFSEQMLAAWQQEQIETQYVWRSATKLPGLYTITTDGLGERSFHYWRSDAAARYWLREHTCASLVALLQQFDWLYLSGVSLAILPEDSRTLLFTALEQVKQQGIKIAFDNNYRPALWADQAQAQACYRQMLALTDLAFLTFDDEQLLWGDVDEQTAISRTQQAGVVEIVIKRGALPCYIVTADSRYEVGAEKVAKIVDTTAAGDSFSAGYLSTRLLGASPEHAAQTGHSLAATVIQYPGAIIARQAMAHLS